LIKGWCKHLTHLIYFSSYITLFNTVYYGCGALVVKVLG
jgi:hypothetical protein